MEPTDLQSLPGAPGLDLQTIYAGGRLCLDFVNTRCRRRHADMELIGSADELQLWLRLAEQAHAKVLVADDQRLPDAYWQDALPRAHALRSSLRDLVTAAIASDPLPPDALEALNGVLRENPTAVELNACEGKLLQRASRLRPHDAWLTTIAEDAADLLCNGDLTLLRECAYPECVRVFYDTTKNHRRRWCAVKCGSHSKAAAYYRRKVAQRGMPDQ